MKQESQSGDSQPPPVTTGTPRVAAESAGVNIQPAKTSNGLMLFYCLFAACWALGSLILVARLIICHWRLGRLRWKANMAEVSVFV